MECTGSWQDKIPEVVKHPDIGKFVQAHHAENGTTNIDHVLNKVNYLIFNL